MESLTRYSAGYLQRITVHGGNIDESESVIPRTAAARGTEGGTRYVFCLLYITQRFEQPGGARAVVSRGMDIRPISSREAIAMHQFIT